MYQKLKTVTNGVYTDLYAKVWSVSGVEPDWQLVVTGELTNDGAEDCLDYESKMPYPHKTPAPKI